VSYAHRSPLLAVARPDEEDVDRTAAFPYAGMS
jgi:hypothetical protein